MGIVDFRLRGLHHFDVHGQGFMARSKRFVAGSQSLDPFIHRHALIIADALRIAVGRLGCSFRIGQPCYTN